MIKLFLGDCAEILKTLEGNSIDSVVTDPPAGISFMNKEWDHHKGGRDQWILWLSSIFTEVKRVLKPGGHCLVWALPRTSHWTAMALEDAGFEIRDCVYHIFSQGFPKSLNIGKMVSKSTGEEREIIGKKERGDVQKAKEKEVGYLADPANRNNIKQFGYGTEIITKGTSEFEGWGTALKPAVECWWLVRKPLSEKTVAENCLKWGVGGLNIEVSRIEFENTPNAATNPKYRKENGYKQPTKSNKGTNTTFTSSAEGQKTIGRFPANLIVSYPENEYLCKENLTKEQKDKLYKWLNENT